MQAITVFKFIIYRAQDGVNAEVLSTDGEWKNYLENGAKFLMWDTSEEAEAFCRTINQANPTLDCVVTMQKCYVNAWLHTGEQEMDMYQKSGLKKWDTDLLLYEGYDMQDTVWFVSESKFHPEAKLAETGHYNVNNRQCYLLKDKVVRNPLETVMTASEADVRLGKAEGTVRVALNNGAFHEEIEKGWVRKSGATWLLTEQAIKRKYGVNCFDQKEQNIIL